MTQLPRYLDEDSTDDPITWTGPILASDRLIVTGSHGEVISVSPYSGAFIGAMKFDAGVTVAPVIADETLLFLTDYATLVALR